MIWADSLVEARNIAADLEQKGQSFRTKIVATKGTAADGKRVAGHCYVIEVL